jgi:hypothetical protein
MAARGINDLIASTKYLRSEGPHTLTFVTKEILEVEQFHSYNNCHKLRKSRQETYKEII